MNFFPQKLLKDESNVLQKALHAAIRCIDDPKKYYEKVKFHIKLENFSLLFSNVVLVGLSLSCFAIGIAQCNQKVWDWWGCTHSCDRYEGREGLERPQGALLWKEQCSPWSCSVQGNNRGLQEVPAHSVREGRLRFFPMGNFRIYVMNGGVYELDFVASSLYFPWCCLELLCIVTTYVILAF